MLVKLVLLITFLGAFFTSFFIKFEISIKFYVFELFLISSKKIFFKVILVLFQTLKPNAQKIAPEIKKPIK
jgi:hypothetical protein